MPKICIDPGHAGRNVDPGATNKVTGLQEADVVLAISKLVQTYLTRVGYNVMLTRTTEEDAASDDLGYRCDLSNEWQADLFVSIHCNSAENPLAEGSEIWTYVGQSEGDVAATKIMNQIQKTFPELYTRADWQDGDVDKESKFYVLKYTDAPACLVELAFISNMDEAAKLADPNWQNDMAKAIARGISDYFAAAA